MTDFRVIAALVARNERPYIANCLGHLIENEIDYVVVDNGSTDGTFDLLNNPHYSKHLLNHVNVPYQGFFHWEKLILARQAAADPIDADWILYVSADEIMHSYRNGETLRSAIKRIAESGYDVIDFNEFVFLPVDLTYVPDCAGPQPLQFYYFFEPRRPRLMRAKKKALPLSHTAHGGHIFTGEPFRLAPETLALRHYMFRDQEHAYRKYRERVFSVEELSRGWHLSRHGKPMEQFRFPALNQLDRVRDPRDRDLNRSNVHGAHYWEWD
jgi:glycosyltransferase involved in cell wall biosynthesis